MHDFHTFGEAMTRKLVTEIAANAAPRDAGRRALSDAQAWHQRSAEQQATVGEDGGAQWVC